MHNCEQQSDTYGHCEPTGRANARPMMNCPRSPVLVIPRACGVSSTLRPFDSIAGAFGILDHRPSRMMTAQGREFSQIQNFKQPTLRQARLRDLAARLPRTSRLLKFRGRKECRGARCARSLVCKKQTHEHSHHGHTGTTRHSPRNGFTAYFALSPVTRLV
jgi:hypothetical protein